MWPGGSDMATIYQSTDVGAPQLSGQAGSLVALLDAVLVDGYGSGADRKPGAGWTKELSAANKRAYRNSPLNGTGFYLQVDDTATVGTARYALVRGYSAMTAFDAGANPTPTTAARADGVVIAKSATLDGGSRKWVIVADGRVFYLFVNPWATGGQRHPYFFGDFISYKPGDGNNWCVGFNGLSAFNESTDFDQYIFTTQQSYASISVDRSGLFLPTTAASPEGSQPGYLLGGFRNGSWQAWGGPTTTFNGVYPHPITQGLAFNPIQILEGAGLPRGELPGIIVPLHDRPFPDLTRQMAGVGLGSAQTLMPVNFMGEIWANAGSAQEGQVIFLEGGDWWS